MWSNTASSGGKKSREEFCADNLLYYLSDFLLIHTCIMKPKKPKVGAINPPPPPPARFGRWNQMNGL